MRKLVDLFLAASVYLVVDQISRARLPKFAVACGVLVLFWNFSGYIEQIMWIPLIAFGLSILSVYFYCRYLDSGRALADYFVISLLLFFAAFATYSIQCGVPVAVFLLGLFRRQERTEGWRLSSAACGAIKDTFYFGVLFVLFLQIWITTGFREFTGLDAPSGSMGGIFQLDPGLFLEQFGTSIANLGWHHNTSDLIGSLNLNWPLWLLVASVGVSAIVFYCLFIAIGRKETTLPNAGSSVSYLDLMLTLAVFCALVAPTVLLESTTATWFPGTRSRMVQQGFQPVLYLSILFLLTEYLFRRTDRIEYLRNGGIALLCGVAVVFGLEYNRYASEQSMFEHKLETGLKKILPAVRKPTHFVVKMKGMRIGVWYSGVAPTMPSLFVETAYNSNAVWLDPVYKGEPGASKLVTLGSDQQGIYSPESGGWIPYQNVLFVEFDGQRVNRLTSIDRETFAGYGVRYVREKPLVAGF
ncbi:MAG: hypothetical protein JO279_06115 [Verrucomicrobia bacterium]|nr:hypothetical protein [Verrucomicrobiota bacterium]